MAVESIRAAVQVRDVAGDHLFVAPLQMALGKVNGVREIDHLTQEVWARAETFDDAGNLRPAR